MSSNRVGGRPPAVSEISKFLAVPSILFTAAGLFLVVSAILRPLEASAPPWCGGVLFFAFGLALGTLTTAFHRLHRWTYPLVRSLLSIPGGGFGAQIFGMEKKIKSDEVRQAFGLPPSHLDKR